MTRYFFILSLVLVSLISVGCCGPMGCGPGCDLPIGCNDCDGLGTAQIAGSPMGGLRQLKRQLVCGSGCGESYIGEWTSTPPDAQDPCCNNQWVGGARKCKPFCWAPGTIVGGLYGGRFCTNEQSSASCGCEADSCSGGSCGGEVITGGYVEEGYIDGGVIQGSGCATCDAAAAAGGSTRIAQRIPGIDPMTRSSRLTTSGRMIR